MGDRLHVNLIFVAKIAKMISRDDEGKISKTPPSGTELEASGHKVLSQSSHRSILG